MISSHRRKTSSGFTLIELLVVIAIIAILAAILFPVFASAKQAGLKATCASQMKQIYTAFSNYADDHGGRVPPVYYSYRGYRPIDGDNYQSSNWLVMIEPYFKKVSSAPTNNQDYDSFGAWKLTRCPSCKLDPLSYFSYNGCRSNYSFYSTLGYNFYSWSPLNLGNSSVVESFPMPISKPVSPSKTVLFVDSENIQKPEYPPFAYGSFVVDPPLNLVPQQDQWMYLPRPGDVPFLPNSSGSIEFGIYGGWQEGPGLGLYGGCSDRHSGMTNVMFGDGHVRTMTLESLKDIRLWDLY